MRALLLCVALLAALSVAQFGGRRTLDRRPSAAIVNGVVGNRANFPFFVSLQMGDYMCGGTIIDSTHVMTAAHCVVDGGRLLSGTVMVTNNRDGYRHAFEARTTRIVVHPRYRESVAVYDMAIITVAREIPFGSSIAPAVLGSRNPSIGSQVSIIGNGETYDGQTSAQVMASTNSVMRCSEGLEQGPNSIICLDGNDRSRRQSSSTCQGDSGGPIFVGRTVVGLVSLGLVPEGMADCGRDQAHSESHYASTSFLRTWILQNAPGAMFDDSPSGGRPPVGGAPGAPGRANGCYTIQPSDRYIDDIADQFSITAEQLIAANPGSQFAEGATIVIPGGGSPCPRQGRPQEPQRQPQPPRWQQQQPQPPVEEQQPQQQWQPQPPVQEQQPQPQWQPQPPVQEQQPQPQWQPQPPVQGQQQQGSTVVRRGEGWFTIAGRVMPPASNAKVEILKRMNPRLAASGLVAGATVYYPQASTAMARDPTVRLDTPPRIVQTRRRT